MFDLIKTGNELVLHDYALLNWGNKLRNRFLICDNDLPKMKSQMNIANKFLICGNFYCSGLQLFNLKS